MEKTVLKVKGMTCMGCVASVKRVLQQVEGVKAVEVSLEQGSAEVEYDGAQTGMAQLEQAVKNAGYEVA
jgi:copper chaperone